MEAEAAEHVIRADLVGNPEAISVLEKAAERAIRAGAPATAAHHLEAAITLAGSHATPPLLLALGQALNATGRPGRAIPVYERLLVHAELPLAIRSKGLRRLGRALMAAGAHEQAAARFRQAADLAQVDDPAAAIQALLDHARACWSTTGPAVGLPLTIRACELARTAETAVQSRAEAALGFMSLLSGDGTGLEAAAAAARVLEADPLSIRPIDPALPLLHQYAERFAEADHLYGITLAAAESIGAAQAIAFLSVGRIDLWIRQGRIGEALALINHTGALAELVPLVQSYLTVLQATVLQLMGRLEESEVCCEQAETTSLTRGEWFLLRWVWHTRGRRCLREGRPEEACDLYARVEAATSQMGIGEPCVVPWARNAVAAYLGCGRVAEASRVIASLEGCAARLPCRWPRIAAATGRGLLTERSGDHEGAGACFRTALALHQEVELPLEKVETLLEYGAFLRRTGEPARARPLLAEALRLAEATKAAWLAGYVRAELQVAGGRRRAREAQEQLTAQEDRVARLAAAGRSNQEIARQLWLSVSTVESHLHRIYAKLGIQSRRALIASAHDHLHEPGNPGGAVPGP
jgi:DNA-binding CsgD family transcriptional regulator